MAVQQNKKSPSKRGMHRAHDFLSVPGTAVEPTTGETHNGSSMSAASRFRPGKRKREIAQAEARPPNRNLPPTAS